LTALLPLLLFLLLLAAADRAWSQPAEDKLEAARESVNAHRFAEAIQLLQSQLADHPEDDDGALLARVLSWQHR
jgi:cytochrome c-type biogenesis protein CcmH/NrfG